MKGGNYSQNLKNLAVIPARKGSKRIKNKNILIYKKKPIYIGL